MATTKKAKTAADLEGRDLARLGFKHDEKLAGLNGITGRFYFKGAIRVSLEGEEGVQVIAFSEAYGLTGAAALGRVCDWETHFTAGTPAEVVIAMLFKATGG